MGLINRILNTLIDIYRIVQTGSPSDFDESGAPIILAQQNPYESVAIDVPARIEGVRSLKTYTSEGAMIQTGSDNVTDLCFMKPLPSDRKLEVGYIVIDQTTGRKFRVREPNKSPGGAVGHHWEIGLEETEISS